MANNLLMAARNLAQHTKRTLFLGGAIAAVTALLVVLQGLSTGIRETMVKSATTFMTGHLNVGGFFKITAGEAAPVVTGYGKIAELLRREVPEVVSITPRGRGWARLVSDTGSMQLGIGGLDIEKEPEFRALMKVKEGSLEALGQKGTILLSTTQAERLQVKVGDQLTFSAPTTRGANNTLDVRVVAIQDSAGLIGSFSTFVSNDTIRSLYQLNPDSTGALHLMVKDLDQLEQTQAKVRGALDRAGYRLMEANPQPFWMKFQAVNREDWTGQKLDVTTWEDEIAFMKWSVQAIDALSGLLIFILLVIIVVGIMNTMWIAIRERTREIGTLRAIGMQRMRVAGIFLTEAALLGLGGTVGGALLGVGAGLGVNALGLKVPLAVQLFTMSNTLRLQLVPGDIVFAIVLISVVTALAALYPALRAAQLQPVTAMHHVG